MISVATDLRSDQGDDGTKKPMSPLKVRLWWLWQWFLGACELTWALLRPR